MGIIKSKHEKMLESKVMDKLREEELDRAILNPVYKSDALRAKMEKPVNVDYFSPSNMREKKHMLYITETGELSTKEYVLNPINTISIGSGKDNTIVLNDLSVGELRCEIVPCKGFLGVRSNDTNKSIVYKRDKMVTNLGPEMIKVVSSDEITLGKTTIKIVLL